MRKPSSISVEIKSVDEGNVRHCVDEYARKLFAQHAEVEEVVVFGSFANGNYSPGSDVDVFILLNRSSKSVRERIPEYLPGAFPVGVDLFPFTKEEVQSLGSSPILREVRKSKWRYRRPPSPGIKKKSPPDRRH